MRIRIIQGTEVDETGIVGLTCEQLRSQMESQTGHVIVDDNPDILHILGALDKSSMATMRLALQRHIAIVYTPLNALAPWSSPTTAKIKLSAAVHCIIASGEMENTLIGERPDQEKFLIRNAVTTSTTNISEMLTAYSKTYDTAYSRNEALLRQYVKERIALLNEDDTTITTLCEKLLYAQCLYQRRNIPQAYLKDLTTFMISNDYDEDRLVKLLGLLQLDIFTQQLEYAMKEQTGLTEGFMPIIWKEDKTSKDILTTLTNY